MDSLVAFGSSLAADAPADPRYEGSSVPVVASFRDLAEAEVASATLEAAGITNVLADAQTIGVDWGYSTALGGITLHVPAASEEEAREVLKGVDTVEWPERVPPAGDERCPICGEFALEVESGPRKTLAVVTALGVPLWLWRSKLRCRKCGSARRVPLRFRPELVAAGLAVGVAVPLAILGLMLIVGYALFGRRV